MKSFHTASLIALAAGFGAASAGGAAPAPNAPEVRVAQGLLRGKVEDGVDVFRSVPFAAPPVGALRFRPPEPPKPWTGVREAVDEPASCPQNATGGDPSGKASTNEDCLYLNVYAPAAKSAAKRPVMVWIHGGGWGEGFADAQNYNPSALVREGGVVVINIAYRLGAFGLLATPSLDQSNGAPSGNYLIEDHLQALRWIKANVSAFGGDPSNVTVVGESAGANSILAIATSPAFKGLMQKAIVQSGVDDAHTVPRARAEKNGEALAETLGCKAGPDQADCLRKAPVEAFLKVRSKLGIVPDPKLFPVDPFVAYRDGKANRIPMIIGSNLHEGYFFAASAERGLGRPMTEDEYAKQMKNTYGEDAEAAMKLYPAKSAPSPAAAYGDSQSDIRFSCYDELARTGASNYAPIWGFEMNEPNPAQQLPRAKVTIDNTSYHTSDLAYLFDRDANGPLTGDAEKLAHKMRAYWIQFMKTGSPNAKGLPVWPRFDDVSKRILDLSNAGGVTTDFEARHRCGQLQEAGLVSPEWK